MKFFIFVIFMAAIASASSTKKSKLERLTDGVKAVGSKVKEVGSYVKAKYNAQIYNKMTEDAVYKIAGEIIGLVADVQDMMEETSEKDQCYATEKDNVTAFKEGATEWAKKNIEPAMEKMEEAFKATFDKLPEKSKAAFDDIKAQITDFVQNMPNDASEIDPEAVKALWESIQEQLKDVFPAVDESTQEGHKENLKKGEELMEAAQKFAEKQDKDSAIEILATLVKDQDEDAAMKILDNVSDMIKKLKENLGGVKDLKKLVDCLPLAKYAAQMQEMMNKEEF